MSVSLSPYLNFNGNAAEAMRFYQSVLGGDLYVQGMAWRPVATSTWRWPRSSGVTRLAC